MVVLTPDFHFILGHQDTDTLLLCQVTLYSIAVTSCHVTSDVHFIHFMAENPFYVARVTSDLLKI